MEKYTIWILVALIAYVLFKDKLVGQGGLLGSSGGTRPTPGPAPSGNTFANTPPYTGSPGPQAPAGTNVWDVLNTGIEQGVNYFRDRNSSDSPYSY